jgi:hypothetical protein
VSGAIDNRVVTVHATGLEATRRAWHAVAELVLAGPQHRRGGGIRLQVVPGGFATTQVLDLRVVGPDLVLPGGAVAINGRTCSELAAAAGVDVGEPRDLYHDGSHVDPDEVLEVDDDAAEELARAYAIGNAALRRFSPQESPVLWPEHFDNAIRAGDINYGVSPGDSYLDVPYAYVGPSERGPDPFWNAPFGAALAMSQLGHTDAVVDFFTEGRTRANGQ